MQQPAFRTCQAGSSLSLCQSPSLSAFIQTPSDLLLLLHLISSGYPRTSSHCRESYAPNAYCHTLILIIFKRRIPQHLHFGAFTKNDWLGTRDQHHIRQTVSQSRPITLKTSYYSYSTLNTVNSEFGSHTTLPRFSGFGFCLQNVLSPAAVPGRLSSENAIFKSLPALPEMERLLNPSV